MRCVSTEHPAAVSARADSLLEQCPPRSRSASPHMSSPSQPLLGCRILISVCVTHCPKSVLRKKAREERDGANARRYTCPPHHTAHTYAR
eukprot:3314055-Rhodomonas_salina.3